MRVRPRLVELLQSQHGDRKRLNEEDYDTLNVMESLVDSLQEDSFLTEGIREWIARLEITLNKLAALKLLRETDGKLQVVSLREAIRVLDATWDDYFVAPA